MGPGLPASGAGVAVRRRHAVNGGQDARRERSAPWHGVSLASTSEPVFPRLASNDVSFRGREPPQKRIEISSTTHWWAKSYDWSPTTKSLLRRGFVVSLDGWRFSGLASAFPDLGSRDRHHGDRTA